MALQARTYDRAAALRETMQTSDALAKEAGQVLEGYTSNLDSLMESVERVAARAQTLTTARRQIDGALRQATELLEKLYTPGKVQNKIKQGPKAGLDAFLAALDVLENCIEFLSCHRSIQTAQDSLKIANGLREEAMLLCFDDFQGHVKRHAHVPPQAAKQQGTALLTNVTAGSSEDVVPGEVVDRLARLNAAMRRHTNSACIKIYKEVRTAVLDSMQQAAVGKAATDELYKQTWPVVERRMIAWIALNSGMARHVAAEQSIAHCVFGEAVGQATFLEIIKPWTLQSSQSAAAFLSYKRVPEKAFGLINMGEKMAECLPLLADVLPGPQIRTWQKLITSFAVESRMTYAELQTFLSADLQRHTVGDGSVHPLAAQTIAFLKRLLICRSAPAIIFAQEQLSHTVFEPGIQNPTQRQALRAGLEELLDLLWSSLLSIARACKHKALAALFLMNNAHYQLKSVQASSPLNAISQDWQDDCENKVEQYGSQYQQAAWNPMLAIMEEGPAAEAKANWHKEKLAIKERWRLMNLAIEALVEQQRTWSVPDFALRGNLRDAILEDFMPMYKVFFRKHEVLPFAKNVYKYMKYRPDHLSKIIAGELFESHSAPEIGGAMT